MLRKTELRGWDGDRKKIQDPPSEPRHSSHKKDTRKWCRGRVGLDHEVKWKPWTVLFATTPQQKERWADYSNRLVAVCEGCGKHLGRRKSRVKEMGVADQRIAVIEEAKSWLRTPFVDNAMVKNCGIACGPLLIAVYRSIGIQIREPDWALFPKDWHMHTTEERYYNMVAEYATPVERPGPGDMVLFRFNRMDKPAHPYCHSGIVIEWPQIIHAYWGKGVEYTDVSKGPMEKREKVFLSPWA